MTTHHDAFLEDITAHPEDDAPRLIYADWLDEFGDEAERARAEFIRVQCELANLPATGGGRRRDLERRQARLLKKYRARWLEPLKKQLPAALYLRVSRGVFRRGFVEQVNLTPGLFLDWGEKLFGLQPITHLRLREVFLDRPRILTSPLLARLRSLDLSREPVRVRGCDLLAGCPHLAGLAELRLARADLTPTAVRTLFRPDSHLRRLRLLDLSENDLRPHGAEVLAGAPHLAGLTHLGLYRNWLAAEGVSALAGSAHLANLTYLDLTHNNILNPGGQALLHSPHLGKLHTLVLRLNPLGPKLMSQLRHRFPEVIA
jgi:uncharacterized protein (TIGR02996 family)